MVNLTFPSNGNMERPFVFMSPKPNTGMWSSSSYFCKVGPMMEMTSNIKQNDLKYKAKWEIKHYNLIICTFWTGIRSVNIKKRGVGSVPTMVTWYNIGLLVKWQITKVEKADWGYIKLRLHDTRRTVMEIRVLYNFHKNDNNVCYELFNQLNVLVIISCYIYPHL